MENLKNTEKSDTENFPSVDQNAENFKRSPLGFLMSVIAKYQANMERSFHNTGNKEDQKKALLAKDLIENFRIELSKTDALKKELSNEAVMMHVLENCYPEERNSVLEIVFEYHNLLENVLKIQEGNSAADQEKDRGFSFLLDEYYDVARLGLLLNCYLGEFDNDDYFYGTLAHVAETLKVASASGPAENSEEIGKLCDLITERTEKAGIDLKFDVFLRELHNSLDEGQKTLLYGTLVRPYAEKLLEKIVASNVEEDDVGRLACVKQIQRKLEHLLQER